MTRSSRDEANWMVDVAASVERALDARHERKLIEISGGIEQGVLVEDDPFGASSAGSPTDGMQPRRRLTLSEV